MAAAPKARFSIPVADLEAGDRELEEDIPADWLRTVLEGTEAVPRDKPGRLEVTISKSGKDVMVRGFAEAFVQMPCARTLDPVDYDLRADIFLMLGPEKAVPHVKARKHDEKAAHAKAKPVHAKSADTNRKKKEVEKELSEDEAALDTYEGDMVVLDRFVGEFLVLELPMFPLREDLRSEASPAIERDPEPAESGTGKGEVLDPRLAPLAAI